MLIFNLRQLADMGVSVLFARDSNGTITGIQLEGDRHDMEVYDNLVASLKADYPSVDHDILMGLVQNMFNSAFKQQLITVEPAMVSDNWGD